MATERTYMNSRGVVIYFTENKDFMALKSMVMSEQDIVVTSSGRIMSSLANHGGLAGIGGIAGNGGGLAG